MGFLSKGRKETSTELGISAFTDQGGTPLPATIFGDMGMALYPEPSFQTHVDHAYTKNELVYACILEKATSLPDAPLRVFASDGMGDPREGHPLRQLIMNPNPVTYEFELFEMTSIHLDLAGNAFWEIVLNNAGIPTELWPLRPDRVRILPRRDGWHEYGYVLGNGKAVPLGRNVIHFKMPNPSDPYLGQAPLRPALRAIALDNEATDFVKVLLQNRAVPGSVITVEQKIDEALVNRLTEKWMDRFGGNRNGRPAFMQKGMTVQPLGLNLDELEFPDLRTISESRICMALGVPPILVGAKVGLDRSTFANYAEARSAFWEETMMPLEKRIAQTVHRKLLPYFEGPRPRRVVVRFDNSDVRALRESEGKRWELATAALRAGGITLNQFARYVGLPDIGPNGDVYLRPAGVIPYDAEGNPTIELTPPAPPAQPSTPDQPTDPATGEPVAAAAGMRSLPGTKVMERRATKVQVEGCTAAVSAFVLRQQAVIMNDLDSQKMSRMAVKVNWNDDVWQAWTDDLAEIIENYSKGFARAGARLVDSQVDLSVMDAYIEKAALRKALDWNMATRDAIAAAAGGPADTWRQDVMQVFDLAANSRASNLASSTATEMHSFGKVDTAKRVGHEFKVWSHTPTCPSVAHAVLDGQRVRVEDVFSNGARWPGDGDRDGCQCSVVVRGAG